MIRSDVEPFDNTGGILADESGLGKTFSVLSLVLETKLHALRWVDKQAQVFKNGDLISCAATLVIVPSDGMFEIDQADLADRELTR